MNTIHVRKINNDKLRIANEPSFAVRNLSFIMISFLLTVCFAFTSQLASAQKRLPRLLVFSKTAGSVMTVFLLGKQL